MNNYDDGAVCERSGEFEMLQRLAGEMSQRIREITNMSDSVSERLFGPFPRVGCDADKAPMPDGQVDRAKVAMQILSDDISDLQTAVERLTVL